MKILAIAGKDLLRLVRSPSFLTFGLFIPLLMGAIFYLAFGGIGSGDEGFSVAPTRVQVANLDTPELRAGRILSGPSSWSTSCPRPSSPASWRSPRPRTRLRPWSGGSPGGRCGRHHPGRADRRNPRRRGKAQRWRSTPTRRLPSAPASSRQSSKAWWTITPAARSPARWPRSSWQHVVARSTAN